MCVFVGDTVVVMLVYFAVVEVAEPSIFLGLLGVVDRVAVGAELDNALLMITLVVLATGVCGAGDAVILALVPSVVAPTMEINVVFMDDGGEVEAVVLGLDFVALTLVTIVKFTVLRATVVAIGDNVPTSDLVGAVVVVVAIGIVDVVMVQPLHVNSHASPEAPHKSFIKKKRQCCNEY